MSLDFQTGVPFKIEGELGQYQTLPLETLIEIARNLQELIKQLAISNISEGEAIDLNHFKIELSDFKKSSAVPVFVFTPRPLTGNLTANVSKQKETVNESFTELMQFSNDNHYENIIERYPLPYLRNTVVECLYGLMNSFGDSPTSIPSLNGDGNLEPIFTMRKITPALKEKLQTRIVPIQAVTTDEIVFGKFQKTTKGSQKPKLKPLDVFTSQSVSLSFAPEIIEANGKKYVLHFPLRCLLEKEDDFFIVKSEQLDLIGTGETEAEAKNSFCQEFDFVFQRYNELEVSRLSPRLRDIKTMLNLFVKSVEQ